VGTARAEKKIAEKGLNGFNVFDFPKRWSAIEQAGSTIVQPAVNQPY